MAIAELGIWEIDADAFVRPPARSATLIEGTTTSPFRIAFANDGKAVVVMNDSGSTRCQQYDPATKAVTALPLDPPGAPGGCFYFRGGLGASADGSRVALVGTGPSPSQNPGFYLGNISAFQRSSVEVAANVAELDRNGSRLVVISDAFPNLPFNEVYDGTWKLLGRLQPDTLRAVLTRDGTKAVAWEDPPSGDPPSGGKIGVYDLTAAPVGSIFPEIGTAVAPGTPPGAGGRIALSADGTPLFLAGDANFVVFPLP